MTPWDLAGKTEHSHQRAIFAWANCAAAHGFAMADDPRGYTADGRRDFIREWGAVGHHPIPELSRLFAVHNQGHGDRIRGAQAKAEGVKAGVPDMFLPVTRYYHSPSPLRSMEWCCGLWIELKHPDKKPKRYGKGATSPDQDDWLMYLDTAGYSTAVAYGWQEAVHFIKEYLTT